MKTKLLRAAVILLFGIIACSIADDANKTNAFLDFNYKTQEVESELNEVTEGEEYFIAIIAENAADLYSYSLKVLFDEKIVTFESAVKSNDGEPSFLESNGGEILTYMVMPKAGEVEIATTLKGTNPGITVNGNGVLGFFKFSGLSSGDPKFKIIETKLVDKNGKGTILTFEDATNDKKTVVSSEVE